MRARGATLVSSHHQSVEPNCAIVPMVRLKALSSGLSPQPVTSETMRGARPSALCTRKVTVASEPGDGCATRGVVARPASISAIVVSSARSAASGASGPRAHDTATPKMAIRAAGFRAAVVNLMIATLTIVARAPR